jgi:uncharacterized protein YdeI (YjbR/CyaY-like superfamily)
MPRNSPLIDAYIEKAAPFARPILLHLRTRIHAACPNVEETLKWSMPAFLYQGKILCGMAAFKQHCTFGFWHSEMNKMPNAENSGDAMGQFGRITGIEQLPKPASIKRLVRQAMKLIDDGVTSTVQRKPKPAVETPDDLAAALRKNAKARAAFERFSPSHRREYIEWIIEAKRPETRSRRLATTLEWLAEGKPRNWKYDRS